MTVFNNVSVNSKVMLLVGSISPASHTRTLMKSIESSLIARSVEVIFWDLRARPLPIADPIYQHDLNSHPNPNVLEFISNARKANAYVLGSPLYHGSYSGVLKNALDHLWYGAFRRKPVALVSHASTATGSLAPCFDLQSVVRTLYGYVCQTQIGSHKGCFDHSDEQPKLFDEEIANRIERLVDELLELSLRLQTEIVSVKS